MNREQRRNFVKKAKATGASKAAAEAYATIIENSSGKNTPPQPFEEDDKVSLNIGAITSRQNYDRMSQGYKNFVADSEGKVYTAHVERPNMISLKECPAWLFWSGDLIKIDE